MNKNLLKIKKLTALDKLFILKVLEFEHLNIPCSLTSQEFATALGVSRKSILNTIYKLEELDFIYCIVVAPTRTTILTSRLHKLIN
jgi:hypothetical protein